MIVSEDIYLLKKIPCIHCEKTAIGPCSSVKRKLEFKDNVYVCTSCGNGTKMKRHFLFFNKFEPYNFGDK